VPAPVSHSVTLSWTASASPNVVGYNVYRSTTSGGPYAKLNGSLVGATTYLDSNVASGQAYFYVATAVDRSNDESVYSAQVTAIVPTP
jgi:fibronectin type 3 domain-containing protein